MRQDCYFIPRSERWVIASLARSVGRRLMLVSMNLTQRRSLMRLLFGLQRFPRITQGLDIHIEWSDVESACLLRLTNEHLSIERGHTRIQYFVGSHHLIDLFQQPVGAERAHHLENWLPLFDGIDDPDTVLSVEDHSTGDEADEPPLNEQWSEPLPPIFFDMDEQ